MDVLANYSIFQELQLVHDTGYFSAMPSLEENWQQVSERARAGALPWRRRYGLRLELLGHQAVNKQTCDGVRLRNLIVTRSCWMN
ncbi:Krueppel-like factor 7 [Tachysurus ichikawai]